MEMRYGMRPVAWLKQEGLLNETLLAVHLTDCTEKEAQMVANSGASMIVCPGSIGIIDGIVPPSLAFQRAGGAVALGSDQACGNNCHNIFNEMKLVALFNKIKEKDPEVLPAWRALRPWPPSRVPRPWGCIGRSAHWSKESGRTSLP